MHRTNTDIYTPKKNLYHNEKDIERAVYEKHHPKTMITQNNVGHMIFDRPDKQHCCFLHQDQDQDLRSRSFPVTYDYEECKPHKKKFATTHLHILSCQLTPCHVDVLLKQVKSRRNLVLHLNVHRQAAET